MSCAAPADTLLAFPALMERLGITRLATLSGFDRIGLPVVAAVRPNARTHAISHGKGADEHAARMSALMEAVEFWHGEHISRPVRLATAAETAGAIDPSAFPTPDGAPADDRPRPWLEGVNLIDGEPTWVPYECVSLVAADPGCAREFELGWVGLGAGADGGQALSHALTEVIEQDALACWWGRAGRAMLPPTERRVDPATVDDPACRELLARLDAVEVDIALWDLTTDVGVPVFEAFLLDRDWDDQGPPAHFGTGCHQDPGKALFAAIVEAIEVRAVMLSGLTDTDSREWLDARHDPALRRIVRILVQRGAAPMAFDGAARVPPSPEALIDALAAIGIRYAVAVDLRHEDLGLPVVRVVAPELETLWSPPRARGLRFAEAAA